MSLTESLTSIHSYKNWNVMHLQKGLIYSLKNYTWMELQKNHLASLKHKTKEEQIRSGTQCWRNICGVCVLKRWAEMYQDTILEMYNTCQDFKFKKKYKSKDWISSVCNLVDDDTIGDEEEEQPEDCQSQSHSIKAACSLPVFSCSLQVSNHLPIPRLYGEIHR